MSIESLTDLKGLRRAGLVVASALDLLRSHVRPGITTAELDAIALEYLRSQGARSAPQLAYDFPGATCISVNEQAVHGVPGPRLLKDGDLVTLDVTVELDGYYADAAITVPVGTPSQLATALCACAQAAFWKGAEAARAGEQLSRVGYEVEQEVRRHGFRVLRELCGHGIGRSIHEDPNVCNFYDARDRTRLTKGLVIALEPIISAGSDRTRVERDGWTVRSADRSLTAHFEHTIAITAGTPIVLTAR